MHLEKQNINQLRKYRLLMGLTQSDVARALGFKSTNRIIRWEQGTAYPSVTNLAKLSVLYATLCEQLYQDLFEEVREEVCKCKKRTEKSSDISARHPP